MLAFLKLLRPKTAREIDSKIRKRIFIWFICIVVLVILAGWIGFTQLKNEISQNAKEATDQVISNVYDVLDVHNQLYLDQVKASLTLMKRDTLKLGPPHLGNPVKVGDVTVNDLMFGNTSIAHDTEIVDSVQSIFGATVAIFVVDKNNSFVRISTNVLEDNGDRAEGTLIDSRGMAVKALRKGEPYAGILDILGESYVGEDDPIVDANGKVIGIWYVGFKIEGLTELMSRISSRHILEHGFVALFDNHNRLVSQSSGVNTSMVMEICQKYLSDDDVITSEWKVGKEIYKPWNYHIVTATYLPDVAWRAVNVVGLVFCIMGVMSLAALVAQGGALIRAQQLKQEAEKARASAEEASKTKSAFLANMSHELRTPLNAIIGYSEMLSEEAVDSERPDLLPDLEKIRSSGKHLLSLISDILDLSKIEAGKMTLYAENFSVPQTIKEIASTIQPLLTQNENKLEVNCPDEVGIIYCDLTKTRQILFNLLSNASKFTKAGTIRLKVTREGSQVRFVVQDSGIGMAPEALKKLFKEFTQADNSTTRKYGGTGLGLAISKRFCEMMEGSIKVDSQVGIGSTFTVVLPTKLKIPDELKAEVERPPEKPVPTKSEKNDKKEAHTSQSRPSVLVIDDDQDVQNLLQRILVKENLSVILAGNGEEALRLAVEKRPRLITLDVMMPGLDGWAVLTELKKNPATKEIPVVVVSIVDNKPMALSLGAADYVTKPFDREKIMDILNRLRDNSRSPCILVLEDNINNYELVEKSLVKEGFKVAYATNGKSGVQMLQEAKPDLILLDLMMPDMDGFEFLVELRRRDAYLHTPVIVLTAKTLTDEERQMLDRSVQKILIKGEQMGNELVSAIRNELGMSSLKSNGQNAEKSM